MALDIGILVILAACALHGYVQGLVRGVGSFVSVVVSLLLSVQACDDLARLFTSNPQPPTPVLVASFLGLLGLGWLALFLGQRLLLRVLDRYEHDLLDQFLGGAVGLGRGVALVWLSLAMVVGAFPASMSTVTRSVASARLLEISGAPRREAAGSRSEDGTSVSDSSDMKCASALRGRFSQYSSGD
jgi:uncharacterized membrane protein required for colicin V production